MTLIPAERKYDSVIITLLSNKRFLNSDDYKIAANTGHDLPGVVAAAYARYVGASVRNQLRKQNVSEIMAPLNILALWRDDMVNDLLKDEVFEQLDVEYCIDNIRPFMNTDLALLWDNWNSNELSHK